MKGTELIEKLKYLVDRLKVLVFLRLADEKEKEKRPTFDRSCNFLTRTFLFSSITNTRRKNEKREMQMEVSRVVNVVNQFARAMKTVLSSKSIESARKLLKNFCKFYNVRTI